MKLNRQLGPTRKIGETEQSRDNRFHLWDTHESNHSHGYYYRRDPTVTAYQTDNQSNMVYDSEELKSSTRCCNLMREVNKNQVLKVQPKSKFAQDSSRPKSLMRSNSSSCYIDAVEWKGIDPIAQEESFQAAFNSYANISDGTISVKDASHVIKVCLGDTTPQFILDKFGVLSWKASIGGRVHWVDFRDIITKAFESVDSDCSIKRETPPLVVMQNKARVVDTALGPFNPTSTVYRDTYNFDGKSAQVSLMQSHNLTRGISNDNIMTQTTRKMVLNPAASVLGAGTTKGTDQIPGFSGHIPANLRNQRKVDHSDGSIIHPTVNNLMLTQKGMGTVLGYSGYVPKPSLHVKFNERRTGMDPRTSTGAAFGPNRQIL
jgi:hypothetical protein